MNTERRKKGLSLVIVAVLLVVFFGAFQLYIFFEKKSYRHAHDLLSNSFSVLEVSMEDEEQTYYLNDKEIIFEQLVQGLDATTFKPTRQTPKNPQYTIRIYNESLQVETTLTVYSSNQMKINDAFYNVDEVDLKMFEQTIFKEKYDVSFRDFDEFATYMYDQVYVNGLYSEENNKWAEVIALARIAKEKGIDLSDMDLLYIAPTKEVATQLIAYDFTSQYDYPALFEAVKQGRLGVAEVLLENEIGAEPDSLIQGVPSHVVLAKLNEDQAMVELLLRYGFEDVHVDSKYIEQVQKAVNFKDGDSDTIIAGLKKGGLPGLDFFLPASTNEVIETWGEYTVDEDFSFLTYNRHSFLRERDLYSKNEDRNDEDVFGYIYQFDLDDLPEIVDVKEVLGEPDGLMMISEVISELEYVFGDYHLSLIVDAEGYVQNINYYYSF